jgi:hypothetical protein
MVLDHANLLTYFLISADDVRRNNREQKSQ